MPPGAALRDWRVANRLTQRALAAAVGLNRQYISDIERGKRQPGRRAMIKLHKFAKGALSLDALIVGEVKR
jgi:transcriptional regulator with XRE-family HTH domain